MNILSKYLINDDWVLNRISNENNSFKSWIQDIFKTAKQAVQDVNPEIMARKFLMD